MRLTVKQYREMAAERGLRVWCANGTGKHGKPGYMGDVTIARLRPGYNSDRKRACDARRDGAIEDERFLTAWRGLISARKRAMEYLEALKESEAKNEIQPN